MSLEMFLQKKLLHAQLFRKGSEFSKDVLAKASNAEKTVGGPRDILSSWCKSSVLNHLIKLYASSEYDNDKYLQGQVLTLNPFV